MKKLVLKQEYIDVIKKDPILFGKVAYILGVGAPSIPRILAANSLRLTEASVLKLLRDHLNITDEQDLLIEVAGVSKAEEVAR